MLFELRASMTDRQLHSSGQRMRMAQSRGVALFLRRRCVQEMAFLQAGSEVGGERGMWYLSRQRGEVSIVRTE